MIDRLAGYLRRRSVEESATGPALPDIREWATSFDVNRKPWLILGKGPSYELARKVQPSEYFTCSLNHVVRERPVDLAHMIDIDVAAECGEALERNARFVVLPYYPHVDHDPTSKSVEDFARELPVLQRLKAQRRLVWYNLSSSAKRRVGSSPLIVARFFSAEAAVNILAECGVKVIRSLGVDGGSSYAPTYEDLKTRTLLANSRSSFDAQFEQIARTILTRGIFYAPLHKEAPVRVFLGTDRSQMLAARVLEYSIKRRCPMSVEVVPMCDLPVPSPKAAANRPRTGFSFARFLIPSLCGYRGRALYLDADMLVFSDLSRLWETPFGGCDLLYAAADPRSQRPQQKSVLLLDCGALRWRIEEIVQGLDEGRYDYGQLMHDFAVVPRERIAAAIAPEWNSLERYEPGATCLLHYTDMPTQPWVSRRNPNRALWYQALRDALADGFIAPEEVYAEVEGGHVMPELPEEVGLAARPQHRQLAGSFVPAFRRFSKS